MVHCRIWDRCIWGFVKDDNYFQRHLNRVQFSRYECENVGKMSAICVGPHVLMDYVCVY